MSRVGAGRPGSGITITPSQVGKRRSRFFWLTNRVSGGESWRAGRTIMPISGTEQRFCAVKRKI